MNPWHSRRSAGRSPPAPERISSSTIRARGISQLLAYGLHCFPRVRRLRRLGPTWTDSRCGRLAGAKAAAMQPKTPRLAGCGATSPLFFCLASVPCAKAASYRLLGAILRRALRAGLRPSKIAPSDFVAQARSIHIRSRTRFPGHLLSRWRISGRERPGGCFVNRFRTPPDEGAYAD